mmetsp:Transcript_31016/g.49815  ORF Transcript_31016/g.49815 Transcript_31016/m.49815 type:complete len:210 (-) Transcript_31016:145-774(-)
MSDVQNELLLISTLHFSNTCFLFINSVKNTCGLLGPCPLFQSLFQLHGTIPDINSCISCSNDSLIAPLPNNALSIAVMDLLIAFIIFVAFSISNTIAFNTALSAVLLLILDDFGDAFCVLVDIDFHNFIKGPMRFRCVSRTLDTPSIDETSCNTVETDRIFKLCSNCLTFCKETILFAFNGSPKISGVSACGTLFIRLIYSDFRTDFGI